MGVTKEPISKSSDDLIPDSNDNVVDNIMHLRRLEDLISDLSSDETEDEEDDLQNLSTSEELFASQNPNYQNTISPILTDQRLNDAILNLINSLYIHLDQESISDSNSTFNQLIELSSILSTNPVIDSTSTLTTNPIIDLTSTLTTNPDIDSTSTQTTNPDINSTSTQTTNPVIVTTTESINITNVLATKPVTKPFIKKNGLYIGRKKANRANNESFLLSLSDDKQKHPEDEIFNNQNKNGFTKVINKFCIEPDLIESFIQGNDEELLMKKKHKSTPKKNTNRLERYFYCDQAFKNLTSAQRSMYKQKSLPLTAIRIIETELVKYFVLNPNGVYTSAPLPKYQRLLIHSISRYYALEAKTMNNRGRRTQKIVQVRNYGYTDFKPTNISLLELVSSPYRLF